MAKRAVLIVLDGCGAGEAPDAVVFGDLDHPSTLLHVWEAVGGFPAPTLAAVGWLAAAGIPAPASHPNASYTRLKPLSMGKDSVTGHWEMMGIILERGFPTYPSGFPADVVSAFEAAIGRSVLGNRPASGTEIIAELGDEHQRTGFPIIYTSADSVFQIAAHESVVPVEQLYDYCQIARRLLVPPNDVARVIARPFAGTSRGFVRTERRKDFPISPPPNLVDRIGDVYGIGVVPELFDGRGFRPVPRTQSNPQHAVALSAALDSDARFIFANFEDFDMKYGHRNDPAGFAQSLVEFDGTLANLISRLDDDDLLILTADHGNDPTTTSTDHSREYVPMVSIGHGIPAGRNPDQDGFGRVGDAVADWLGVP